jgi:hypothetical protein
MSATPKERAVINAARAVFSERHAGIRPDRIYELKAALDSLELEYIAAELSAPTMEERFRSALEIIGANRAQGVYERLWAAGGTVTALHAMDIREVLDIHGAGPNILAALAAALEHAGLDLPLWARSSRHEAAYFAKLCAYRDTLKAARHGRT